jgi:hypothetical protein
MKSYRSLNLLAVTTAVILSLALASPGVAQQRRGSGQVGSGGGACAGGVGTLFDQTEITYLSGDEESHIVYMREEEKLARDVYLTLADTWQLPIFGNIAGAEQRHMDALKRVLDLYDVADPVVDDTVGVFANTHLADLYTELVTLGNTSLMNALIVGATIEDLDLYDLDEMLGNAENDHVQLVGNNLAKGSRNHLRAFMGALIAQDGSYEPQYISQEAFDAILDSEMERRVVYGADGEAIAAGGNGRGGQGRRGRGQGNGNRGGSGSGTGECDGSGPQGGGQTGGPST